MEFIDYDLELIKVSLASRVTILNKAISISKDKHELEALKIERDNINNLRDRIKSDSVNKLRDRIMREVSWE